MAGNPWRGTVSNLVVAVISRTPFHTAYLLGDRRARVRYPFTGPSPAMLILVLVLVVVVFGMTVIKCIEHPTAVGIRIRLELQDVILEPSPGLQPVHVRVELSDSGELGSGSYFADDQASSH